MRKWHVFSLISSYCLWIVAFAFSLALLGAISRSSQSRFSGKGNEFGGPISRIPSKEKGNPPVLAYWIYGSSGDSERMMRLLKAAYHPRNRYLLELDSASSHSERESLALSVQSEKVFEAFANVDVIGKSYAFNEMGSSALAAALHAAALFLKINADWDWFIPLSAADYPLMTQDDLLHALTFLPRNLNFVHYNETRWKERQTANRIVIDPSLYSQQKSSPIMYSVETRETPEAFNVFGGSPWMMLTRDLMEYCIHGWDNLPRRLLLYTTNLIYPLESYFHTLLCNSPDFKNTTLNTDLSYTLWDPTFEVPHLLTLAHFHHMVSTPRPAFARPFDPNDAVLDKIDRTILNRTLHGFASPGHWCAFHDDHTNQSLSSLDLGCLDLLRPGSAGVDFRLWLTKLVQDESFGCSPSFDQ